LFGGSVKRLIPLALLGCIGCSPDLGEADPEAAAEIVYDAKGVPAYAGQALVIQSCGAGGFCHASELEDLSYHYGAPAGLTFDLTLEATTTEVTREEGARLTADHNRVKDMARTLWGQVLSGSMPPGGAAGDDYRDRRNVTYDRVADDGVTFTPLPELDTEDGREILRNWLAAGAPIIRRTQRNANDDEVAEGECAPICPRTCVDVTWESIYTQIIRPSCALSRCHDHEDPQGDLDLLGESAFTDAPTLEGALRVRNRLLEHRVTTDECREMDQTTMLAPGDPMTSLFYLKVAPSLEDPPVEVCGGRMPAAGTPLVDQEICAIRAWITCGACAEPNDVLVDPTDPESQTCGDCLQAARSACGIANPFDPATASAECVETPVCSNVVPENSCPPNPR
jgi:hypothetical protein